MQWQRGSDGDERYGGLYTCNQPKIEDPATAVDIIKDSVIALELLESSELVWSGTPKSGLGLRGTVIETPRLCLSVLFTYPTPIFRGLPKGG